MQPTHDSKPKFNELSASIQEAVLRTSAEALKVCDVLKNDVGELSGLAEKLNDEFVEAAQVDERSDLERFNHAIFFHDEPGVVRKVLLSTGSLVRFHKRKGQALINAQRKANGDASRMAFALLSEVITIDGKAVLMEELADQDLFDLIKLQGIFGELSGEMGKASPTR